MRCNMAEFKIDLHVINSGSPNGLPCKGAASECYLSIGRASPHNPKAIAMTKLFVANICNDGRYPDLLDTSTSEEPKDWKTIDTVNIDIAAPPAIILTFSIFSGVRVLDKAIFELVKAAAGFAFDKLYAPIAATGIGGALKDILKGFEKQSATKMFDGAYVDTIGVETIPTFGTLAVGESFETMILSSVDRTGGPFIEAAIIHVGDPVATVKFTRVA
jgi:hypothetical protein